MVIYLNNLYIYIIYIVTIIIIIFIDCLYFIDQLMINYYIGIMFII